MSEKRGSGSLIIIGGGEDRDPRGRRVILREVARRVRGGKLVLATVASHQPEGYFDDYEKAFADLEVGELVELYVEDRAEAGDRDKLQVLDDAAAVFFSGGDQLRITSQIGDSGIEAKVRALFERGGTVAGTSAGASVMSDVMLVRGTSGETHRIGDLHMAPGLGLIRDVIIDQHFAERGRFGRLIGAVAHNPRILGIGIDEDTAAIAEGDSLEVIGSGAVYIVDGSRVSHCNLAEAEPDRVLSMHGVVVHVLGTGDRYDLAGRRPIPAAK
ncbi:cyanophycinase [Sphingosinicella sp. CPCC 101087]|uniref:cyanophycinase n=1 Tax=Sphingosinicella sp. CPCC 101087 TaxID=2497754 RepID=UPI00101B9AFB|nr:cyanophycinase [Sphingosinicella sp. CPCC 101087]